MTEPDIIPFPNTPETSEQPLSLDAASARVHRPRNRQTTTETITYEREDGEPFQIQTKCWRAINQDTQPYQREIKVGEEWKPIDLGWADEWEGIGTISIQHLGDKAPQRVLSPEEATERASRGFYVGLESLPKAYLEFYPSDSFRAILSDARALRIRAKTGTVRLLLTILPS